MPESSRYKVLKNPANTFVLSVGEGNTSEQWNSQGIENLKTLLAIYQC